MILQDGVFTAALTGIALVALLFVVVTLQSDARPGADEQSARRHARLSGILQGWWFFILLIGFIGGSWATLRNYPIPAQHGDVAADQVVQVTGRMWSWSIEPSVLKVGETIEFRVTSEDVNHGFAIYSPEGRLLTQTQAMPEYTNRIVHVFDTPGTYQVFCLEYCGVGHAPMRSSFEVVEREVQP